MSHTDIKSEDGIISKLPDKWRPYAVLMRLDRPIGWWLLLLPGWWSIVLAGFSKDIFFQSHLLFLMALFFLGAIIMRGAGCIVNDLWDRDLDMKVTRTQLRPLASGLISLRQAFIFLAILLSIGLGILLQTTPICIILGFASLFLIVTYPLMKRVTWWPQAFLGITFNFGALMGWAAVSNDLSFTPILLYIGGFFWTLGYDTIYAHQDIEDDVMAGVKSTARLFGARSKIWVAGFYGLSFIFIYSAVMLVFDSVWSGLFLMPAACHLAWQVKAWQLNAPESALRFFKSNRDFGLLILAGIILSVLFL